MCPWAPSDFRPAPHACSANALHAVPAKATGRPSPLGAPSQPPPRPHLLPGKTLARWAWTSSQPGLTRGLDEPQIPEPSPPAGRACVSWPPGASGGRGAHTQPVSTCVGSSQPRVPEAQARRPFWNYSCLFRFHPFSGDRLWVWGASCPELDACTWPGQPCVRITESRRFPAMGPGSHSHAIVSFTPHPWFVSRREHSGPWSGSPSEWSRT